MIDDAYRKQFLLLKRKDVYAILDGDTKFGEYQFSDGSTTELAMPYLTGSKLINILINFGVPVESGASRWEYVDMLLTYCIEKHRGADFLKCFFSRSQFEDKLKAYSYEEIEKAHKEIASKAIEGINDILHFGKNKIIWNGREFFICPIDDYVEIEIPQIKKIDNEYIRGLYERALHDIKEGNYDSSLTKARTILEETFEHALDEKCIKYDFKGDIHALYKQVKKVYNMHANRDADLRINKILSGLESIVAGVSELRNIDSDAHAAGRKRFRINDYHARLVVNSAALMGEFILSVVKNRAK